MRWPWQVERGSDMARRKAESNSDDARVHLRTLAQELQRSIDRLEDVVSRLEQEHS